MIIVWPLIVSKTVNPNILPGVCKALEKYVYMYELDDVIETANRNIRDNQKKSSTYNFIKKVGSSLRLESTDIDPFNYIEEAGRRGGGKKQTQTMVTTGSKTSNVKSTSNYNISTPPSPPQKRDAYGDAYANAKAQGDYKKVTGEQPTIGKMDASIISTEPTWNVVTDQQGRTSAIGVKVVPFVINNEQSLIKLMTLDRYRQGVSVNVHFQARRILKFMHNLANRTWKSTVGKLLSWTGFIDDDLESGTLTQNWKNDIILQNTAFKEKMFILLNKMDLEDDFTNDTKGVKKLFTLGWTSFIISDDMNKTVNFCMKSYKGMCSIVNYGFLYADSRAQHQVYQDIEDIRKSSGPLFRLKNSRKTMITDDLAQYKLNQYSTLSESNLTEGVISDVMTQLKNSPNIVVSNLKSLASAVKRQDFKLASTISKKIVPDNNRVNINEVIDKNIKSSPMFKKHFELSKMVFKNSLPGLDDDTVRIGAALLASFSSLSKDKNYNIKNDLKSIVMKTRDRVKTLSEDDDNFNKDLKVAFIFAIVTILFSGALAISVIYAITSAMPVIAASVTALAPWVFGLILLSYAIGLLQTLKKED